MSLTLIIIIGAVVLLLSFLLYSNKKMNKLQDAKTSKKIIILDKKNFNMQTRKGTVLVDFWASWCAPCKMMSPILNEIAEKESDKIKVAKVNVEYNQHLAKKFKVKNIPTLIFFKDGIEVKRIMGVKTKKALMKEIDKL